MNKNNEMEKNDTHYIRFDWAAKHILRVKAFNKEPENEMDEWMDYLKNERIRQDTAVPGLQKAKRRLDYLKMTVAEQKIYDNSLYNKFYREDVLNTSRTKGVVEGYHEGEAKGRAEGMQEGLAKGRTEGLQEGLEKGRTEGLQEGLEKGRAEGLKEAAAKMKQLGIPAEQIAQSTGIPAEEIKGM
ncbi:MAG: hypothetical protein IKO59_01155 [Bacteroidales bacterium]|nr:hypothetical protein [Bacteroidales bacterium]